jgi:hypothetical protein
MVSGRMVIKDTKRISKCHSGSSAAVKNVRQNDRFFLRSGPIENPWIIPYVKSLTHQPPGASCLRTKKPILSATSLQKTAGRTGSEGT